MGSDYPFVKSLLYLIPQSVQLSLRKVYIVSSSFDASWAWRPGVRFHLFWTYCTSFLSFQSLRKLSFVYWKRQFRVLSIFLSLMTRILLMLMLFRLRVEFLFVRFLSCRVTCIQLPRFKGAHLIVLVSLVQTKRSS